jgi:hypothetical protein
MEAAEEFSLAGRHVNLEHVPCMPVGDHHHLSSQMVEAGKPS